MYNIEYVYGTSLKSETTKYAIKWQRYGKKDMTWEPYANLGKSNDWALKQYFKVSDYYAFYNKFIKKPPYGVTLHIRRNELERIDHRQEEYETGESNNHSEAKEEVNENQITVDESQKVIFGRQRRQKNNRINYNEQSQDEQPMKLRHNNNKSEETRKRQQQKQKVKEEKLERKIQRDKDFYEKKIQKEKELQEKKEQREKEREQKEKELQEQKLEDILSQGYLDTLKQTISSLTDQDEFIEKTLISNDDPYEILAVLLIIDRKEQFQEVIAGLNSQYEEVNYAFPKESAGGKKSSKKGKPRLVKNSQQKGLTTMDLVNSLEKKNEFALFQLISDDGKKHGQVGFDRGEKIIDHMFGIPIADTQQQTQIMAYFLLKFKKNDLNIVPEQTYITRDQAELYEKQLLIDYVKENKDLLPQIYQDLVE